MTFGQFLEVLGLPLFMQAVWQNDKAASESDVIYYHDALIVGLDYITGITEVLGNLHKSRVGVVDLITYYSRHKQIYRNQLKSTSKNFVEAF